jgi:PIN domain nuclease of toxin-antitoxin system
MRHVLDTHAAVWNALDSSRLGAAACSALAGATASEIIISDVTLTEVARMICKGIITPSDPVRWLDALAARHTVVPVTPRIAWVAVSYGFAHKDPCDRHILATADVLGLPLVTADGELTRVAPALGVRVIW